MRSRPAVVAQKLLNLYRQAHVIVGGWGAVNPIFVNESTDDVMAELVKLPNGKKLAEHIENLKSGKTAMNTIYRGLQPYGGGFSRSSMDIKITETEIAELEKALGEFFPDDEGLNKIKQLPIAKKFGNEWLVGISRELSDNSDMSKKWHMVVQTARAYELWHIATWILSEPMSERARARVQADLPEFETYLPMFGEAGEDLLAKLLTLLNSVKK